MKLDIQRFADAEVVFQLTIDSKSGEAQIKRIENSLDNVNKKTSSVSQDVSKLFTGVGGTFTKAGSSISKFVTAPVTALGVATAKTAIDFVKLKESSMGVFKQMLGGSDAAEDMYQSLLNVAKASTYSQEAFLTAGKTLVGMGTNAQDTTRYLQAITNAVAGFGGSSNDIEELASVFGKVSAKGKVLTDDLNMLSERGVNGLQILASHYGVTTDVMQDMVSKGMVPAKEGLDILVDGMENGYTYAGEFHKGMSGMAQSLKNGTLTGALDSLKSSFRNMSVEMWDAFQNKPEIINAVNSIGNAMNKLPSIMGPITKAVGPMLQNFANQLNNVAKMAEKHPKLFESIVKAIVKLAIAGPILLTLGKTFTGVSNTIEAFTKVHTLFGKKFSAVSLIVKGFSKIGTGLISVFKLLGTGISIVTKAVWGFTSALLANPITWVVIAIVALIAILAVLYKKCEGFRNIVNSIVGFIVNLFMGIIDFFKNNWQTILLFMINPFAGLFKLLYDKCEGFRNVVNGIIDFIKNVFILIVAIVAIGVEGIFNVLKTIVLFVWNNILSPIINFIKSAISLYITIVSTFVTTVFNIFLTIATFIWNNVLSPIINFFKSAFNFIWGIVSSGIEQIKNGFMTIASVVKSVFSSVKSFISNIFSSVAGVIKAPINGVIGIINNVLRSMNKIKVPDWVPGLGGKGVHFSMIPKLSTGTNYVEHEGLAYLHQGEAVVPKKYNPAVGGINQPIYVNVEAEMGVDNFGRAFVKEVKTFSGGAKNDFNYGGSR